MNSDLDQQRTWLNLPICLICWRIMFTKLTSFWERPKEEVEVPHLWRDGTVFHYKHHPEYIFWRKSFNTLEYISQHTETWKDTWCLQLSNIHRTTIDNANEMEELYVRTKKLHPTKILLHMLWDDNKMLKKKKWCSQKL